MYTDITGHITDAIANAEPMHDRLFGDIGKGKLMSATFGYIYVLRMLDSSYLFTTPDHKGCSYKIGKTKDVNARMKTIKLLLPTPAELIVTLPADTAWGERYLHEKLAGVRMNGEWFALQRHHVLWLIGIGNPFANDLSEDHQEQLDSLYSYYESYCPFDPQ